MPTPHRSDQHQLERLTGTLNRLNKSTAPKALTGTVTATYGSATLAGAGGSAFDTELAVGDGIMFSGDREQVYKVITITSATVATIEPAFRGATAASQTMIGYTGAIDNSTLSGLANPGTVALLNTAILAKSVHVSDVHLRNAAAANLRLAAEPFFSMSPPTMGNVTTAASGGTLVDSATIYYILVAIDLNGNFTVASAEDSVATGGAAGNDSVNTIPWTDVGGNFTVRVYASAADGTGATGVYTHYKDVTDGTSTTDATAIRTGWTAEANTAATIAARAAAYTAGYGLVTDDMVDDARDAALFSTLRNAISDQNSRGTAARTDDYATNAPFIP